MTLRAVPAQCEPSTHSHPEDKELSSAKGPNLIKGQKRGNRQRKTARNPESDGDKNVRQTVDKKSDVKTRNRYSKRQVADRRGKGNQGRGTTSASSVDASKINGDVAVERPQNKANQMQGRRAEDPQTAGAEKAARADARARTHGRRKTQRKQSLQSMNELALETGG